MNDVVTLQHPGHANLAPHDGQTPAPSEQPHPAPDGTGVRAHMPPQHGRDKIDWPPEVWHHIDAAVRHEIRRSRIAAKFLPTVHVPSKTMTVPADSIDQAAIPGSITIDEFATTPINQVSVGFTLTPSQVEEEAALVHGTAQQHPQQHQQQHQDQHQHQHQHPHQHQHASTAVTLATRAANILSQIEDTIIFQGSNAWLTPLFIAPVPIVSWRFRQADFGLLQLPAPGALQILPANQIITVSPVVAAGPYQWKTVTAVAQAFSALQANGQWGPYALVLHTVPFADINAPLPTTLITPAQPIRQLMNAGVYGCGALPPPPAAAVVAPMLYTGLVVSLGGNTMDLVRGKMNGEDDVIVRFEQKDVDGNYRFTISERFTVRLKDPTAVILLEFNNA